MIRYSVCGAASYVCGELLRLMINHPHARLAHLAAHSAAGKNIQDEHPALAPFYGQTILPMNEQTLAQMIDESDVIFTILDAGEVPAVANMVLQRGKKLIDFGADLRFRDAKTWENWYHLSHPDHALTKAAVYCIPELMREEARGASLLANPGCYPTATTLALAPVLKEGLVAENSIIVDGKSGYSGAGRRPTQNKLLTEGGENFCAYALGGTHRHTPEIEQNIAALTGKNLNAPETWQTISFQPHLIPQSRGIEVSIYATLNTAISNEQLLALYESYYKNEPFVRIFPANRPPQTKWVSGSNLCYISPSCDARTRRMVVSAVIDNIGKGAAGQAVQNMNLMFDIDETTGLMLAPLFP